MVVLEKVAIRVAAVATKVAAVVDTRAVEAVATKAVIVAADPRAVATVEATGPKAAAIAEIASAAVTRKRKGSTSPSRNSRSASGRVNEDAYAGFRSLP